MRLNEYTSAAFNTAIYPRSGSGDTEELMYLTLGLLGEAGELANKVKKEYRDAVSLDVAFAKKELGDIMWYWSQICRALSLDPEEILDLNIAKLADRKERGVLTGNGDNR